MGTSGFLIGMSVFVIGVALVEHRHAARLQFDAAENNFTLLT
jgi:hypothetical protein